MTYDSLKKFYSKKTSEYKKTTYLRKSGWDKVYFFNFQIILNITAIYLCIYVKVYTLAISCTVSMSCSHTFK